MIQGTALKDVIAERIRQDIMHGVLKMGERISEAEYARSFEVSRTPVREALLALASLGLVTVRPQAGTYVISFTPQSLRHLFEVRRMMEVSGVRMADAEHRATLVVELRRQLAAMDHEIANTGDFLDFMEFDTQFHVSLVSASGNDLLVRHYAPISACAHAARSRLTSTGRIAAEANDHHRAIVQAIATGDLDDFERLLTVHLDWVLEMLLVNEEVSCRK